MVVIVGESASGKSTLARSIVDNSKDLKLVVTYTTRPPRPGEIDGIDYHFVSNECFAQMVKDCKFVEYTTYRGWHYGTAASDCLSEKSVVVLNPTGLRAVKRIGYDVTSIYLNVDRRSRLIKMLDRGDDIEEAYRRSLSDEGQFAEVRRETTAVLDNPKYQYDIEELTKRALDIIDEVSMRKRMSKMVGQITMFKDFKIYTAGKMTGLDFDEQMKWRQGFSNAIYSCSGGDYSITLFHPPLYYDDDNYQTDNEVMEFDLAHMLQCDIVVVNLENIETSIGTIMELATIRAHNRSGGRHIFVVGIGKSENQHPWVRCCVSRFVDSVDEAAKYIRNFFFV